MYGHVITKFSRMDSLPHFLTHGAPLLHPGQGRCQSALGPQAPDDNLMKANRDQPQTLAEDETQAAEVPPESDIQAWSPNVY